MQLKDSRVENYFAKLETQILGRMNAGLSPDEAREELVRNTGISDPILIDEIIQLGIPHEGVVAFRIYPLILVAWVEGISDAERVALKNAVKEWGFHPDSIAGIFIDEWTRKPPEPVCMDAWQRYWRHLTANMSPASVERLIETTRKQLITIAEASGGLLGFGSISKAEQKRIREVTERMSRGLESSGS